MLYLVLFMTMFIVDKSFAEPVDDFLGNKLVFNFDKGAAIHGSGEYYLECTNRYLSVITLAGSIDPDNSFRISKGKEKGIIYVEGESAKFYGANYIVLRDVIDALVLFRFYPPSSLTEVVTVDKKTGIAIDTKTMVISANLAPKTDTYLMNCR